MVIAMEVPEGRLVMEAVAPLVPPVMVSATVKPELEPTVIVTVPAGYSVISAATVMEVCLMVHWFKPRLAQSARSKFIERFAVFRS